MYRALVEAHNIRTGSKCETIDEAKSLFVKVYPNVTFHKGKLPGVVFTAWNFDVHVGFIIRLAGRL